MRNVDFLFWEIVGHSRLLANLPSGILTPNNSNLDDQIPPEIGLLLPGPQAEVSLPSQDHLGHNAAVGLFLADPTINRKIIANAIQQHSNPWITNLPSVTQHDLGFRQTLEDVSLGASLEFDVLEYLSQIGLKILALVQNTDDARMALQSGADALLVFPPTAAFEWGFPSAQSREQQITDIRSALTGLKVPLLGLLDVGERSLPLTWPSGLDAGVLRPRSLN